MASFTGVGDNTVLTLVDKNEQVDIAISGTYNMTIALQRELGAHGSGAWVTIKTYTTANATVAESYTTRGYNERVRLIVTVDTSGTATATLADGSVLEHRYDEVRDRVGNLLLSFNQNGATFEGNLTVDGTTTLTGAITLTGAAEFASTVEIPNTGLRLLDKGG